MIEGIFRFFTKEIIEGIVYALGLGAMWVLSGNRYPSRPMTKTDHQKTVWAGCVDIAILFVALAVYNNPHEGGAIAERPPIEKRQR